MLYIKKTCQNLLFKTLHLLVNVSQNLSKLIIWTWRNLRFKTVWLLRSKPHKTSHWEPNKTQRLNLIKLEIKTAQFAVLPVINCYGWNLKLGRPDYGPDYYKILLSVYCSDLSKLDIATSQNFTFKMLNWSVWLICETILWKKWFCETHPMKEVFYPIKKLPIFRELRLKQLQLIGSNLGYFPIHSFSILPLPCTQWAFDIHLPAFLEVLTGNLG